MIKEENDWIYVEKQEFVSLLEKYPASKLTANMVRICTPEILSYGDFTNGLRWPESTVAQEFLEENYKDMFPDAKNEFRIRKTIYERLKAEQELGSPMR